MTQAVVRKVARSFMDDYNNANIFSLFDEDRVEPKVKQQKIDLEKQKISFTNTSYSIYLKKQIEYI